MFICFFFNSRAITDDEIRRALSIYKSNSNSYSISVNNPENFGYYLAGEGDGHISIPALFKLSIN
jgi:hypothetical protein